MPEFKDLTGKQFGRLTVKALTRKYNNVYWICECSCGNEAIVSSRNLGRKLKPTNSCGCIASEWLSKNTPTLKHGLSRTREHSIWRGMIDRCHNQKNSSYSYYGAKGIEVFAEWRDDFMAFYNHIGARPSNKHEVDRIDNLKGYEPNNVRWVLRRENILNRELTLILTHKGVSKPLADWCNELNVNYSSANRRFNQGLSSHEVLFGESREHNLEEPSRTGW